MGKYRQYEQIQTMWANVDNVDKGKQYGQMQIIWTNVDHMGKRGQ